MFVVVYAEDRLLGPQSNVSILPGGRRNDGSGRWARSAKRLVCRSRTWMFRCVPARPAGDVLRRVVGLPLPGRSRRKRQRSPVCSIGEQCHLPANEAGPRGERDARAGAGCLAGAHETQGIGLPRVRLSTSREKAAHYSTAFAGSDDARQESRLCCSRASLNLDCP